MPGSNASDSTEIYQEGLRIPPLKLYDRGDAQRDAGDADQDQRARARSRVGRSLRRSTPPPRSASAGSRSCSQRYGADEVEAYMSELLDYAERLTRAEIKTWPEGHATNSPITSTATASPTRRSRSRSPSPCARTARCWSTTPAPSPQVKGALNSTLSFTHSLTYLSVRCVLPKDVPNNVGFFRCIEVKVPEASVLNPVMPGPVRRARAHRLPRVRHHAGRAGADRARARAGRRRGRQQRHLHQRAQAATASPSSSST